MKHDYAAALYEINKAGNQKEGGGVEFAMICAFDAAELIANHYDAIRHALLMMQKLQEPSEGMVDHAATAARSANAYVVDKFETAKAKERVLIQAAFHAMLEQAEKEIEGGV